MFIVTSRLHVCVFAAAAEKWSSSGEKEFQNKTTATLKMMKLPDQTRNRFVVMIRAEHRHWSSMMWLMVYDGLWRARCFKQRSTTQKVQHLKTTWWVMCLPLKSTLKQITKLIWKIHLWKMCFRVVARVAEVTALWKASANRKERFMSL